MFKHNGRLTFRTTMRIAMSPLHVGLGVLQKIGLPQVSTSSIKRARLRIAVSSSALHWEQFLRRGCQIVASAFATNPHASLAGLLVPPSLPTVAVISWKFDGTPHPVVVRTVNHEDSRGIDAFTQRGSLGWNRPDGSYSCASLLVPPLPLQAGNARNMLKALRAKEVVGVMLAQLDDFILAEISQQQPQPQEPLLALEDVVGCAPGSPGPLLAAPASPPPPLVLVLCLSHDEAAANLKLASFIAAVFKKYMTTTVGQITGSMRAKRFVLLTFSTVCVAHQLSLASCSQYARLQLPGSGAITFVSRFLGLCHIYASGAYFRRIIRAASANIFQMKVLPASASWPCPAVSQRVMNDRCTLVCFLARCMTQKPALSAKLLAAIEELKLLNGDWRQPLVHLCSGASTCSCGGDSAASIQRRVRNCLSVLLYRNIAVPSTTRWTSMLPALSFIALWSLIH